MCKHSIESLEEIKQPLEPVEYLARSSHRVAVLDAVREEPRVRNELKQMTDVSRVTLSRILADFEDRGWIERTNGRYEATSEGEFVAAELTGLLANIETLDHIEGAMEWLPTEAFDFDLACLQGAEVSTSSWGDHTAQIRRVADLIHGSNRITATASGVSREVVEALWEATVTDGATFEAVLDTTALDIVRTDPELRQQYLEVIEAGAEIRLYEDEEEPLLMVMVCDDTVIVCGRDEDGPPPGTLDTSDERVRAWAESYVETVRAESELVEPDVFRN